MFSVIPIFGAKNTPIIAKIGVVVGLSLILVPLQLEQFTLAVDDVVTFSTYMLTESIVGFSMGLVTLIIMNVFYLAGTIVDRNIGFAMVSVISAQDESQLPVSANFYYIFGMMIFILTNFHHRLIEALTSSYLVLPIGSNPIARLIFYDYVEVLSYSFVIGFKVASPFILTILIVNVLLGLLSKAMPGMNVFMIGMPLKILVGLFIFMTLLPMYSAVFYNVFENMMLFLYKLIGLN